MNSTMIIYLPQHQLNFFRKNVSNQESDIPLFKPQYHIMRELVLVLLEERPFMKDKKMDELYRWKDSFEMQIPKSDKPFKLGRHLLWIPPAKMEILSKMIQRMMLLELNYKIDLMIGSGQNRKMKRIINVFYEKYDIDSHNMTYEMIKKQYFRMKSNRKELVFNRIENFGVKCPNN